MYVEYNGEIEDEIFTELFDRILEEYGITGNDKKKISRKILDALDDFFNEVYY